ncbi:hypothetical protein NBE98_10890 [Clostridium swellfunianum]|uniref:hypothetical protein n=1 Tax=Clostridium swellfunianum TaxID=1367462 RepID=UPI00202E5D18|nr:hypothetical protein [Clostridium swellfunianum]MCM0648882.1 hypothetical protein [Clostridium swellfunianum]
MKKKLLSLVGLIVFMIIAFKLITYFKNTINADRAANLEGELYYTKRINGTTTLFNSL